MKDLPHIIFQKNWIEEILGREEDSKEELALKKTFFLSIALGLPVVFITAIALHFFELNVVALYMSFFALFEFLLLFIFVWVRKKTMLFALVNQSFFLIFSFAAALGFGGILNSGGVILIGLAGVINSVIFLKPAHTRILLIVYMFLVLTTVVLDPFVIPLPEITPRINIFSFVIHLLLIATSLLFMLSFYFEQSSRLKQMEAEHLRELDKLKTLFFTNITHELRTPLAVILGLSGNSLLSDKEDILKNMQIINRNGNRLLQLINRILDLSKLEAKAMKLNPIQADIISFIKYFIESFEHLAAEKNIQVIFQYKPEKLVIDFDPVKIESIIGNLLTNSIKFANKGTQIVLSVSEINTVLATKQDGFSPLPYSIIPTPFTVEIQIEDEGEGIHSGHLPYIFERFYQCDKSGASKSGSGIGLLLVKELVSLMRGNLFVKSESGRGTIFIILLPLTKRAPANRDSILVSGNMPVKDLFDKSQKLSGKNSPKILIVEDNNDLVYFLCSILQTDFSLIRASNGQEGMEMALKIIPDLVVSDIMMPLMDGYELCDRLKNDFRTSHIPVVLLTAKVDVESRISGYKSGADAYVSKPFEAEELRTIIFNLIANREKLKSKFRAFSVLPVKSDSVTLNTDETFLLKLRGIMDDNYSEDQFGSMQLIMAMGMSRVQLFRKLKALTGLSATNYIRLYRLQLARHKIEKTGLTISEIAYECGFSDPAYFSHAFNKEFGLAPSKIRLKTQEFETSGQVKDAETD